VLGVLFGRQQDFIGRYGNTEGPMNPHVLPDRVVERVEGAVTLKA